MKKLIIKPLVISVAAATVLAISGCGTTESGSTSNTSTTTKTTTSGKAVDGYIAYATVCLDLNKNNKCDKNATYEEPTTMTDINGSYSLTISPEQKEEAIKNKAPIILIGGVDIYTHTVFSDILKSPFDGKSTNTNITPLTKTVEGMVENGKSLDEAYNKVATALGLNADEVKADPIELAEKNNTKALKSVVTLQQLATIIAEVAEVNTSDVYNNIINYISDTNETNKSISDIVKNAIENSNLLSKAKNAVKAADIIENIVENALKSKNVRDAALVIDYVAKDIRYKLKNASTIDDSFISTLETNASNLLESANPIRIAVMNLLKSFGISFPDTELDKIIGHFTNSSEVGPENILELSDIDPSIKNALYKKYNIVRIKFYVAKHGPNYFR
jgi:hypothetical protein